MTDVKNDRAAYRACETCGKRGYEHRTLHDNAVQRYNCKACHSTPDDPYFR
jgi:hypothetical protein